MTNKRVSRLVVAILLAGCGGNPDIGSRKADDATAVEDRSVKSVPEEPVVNTASAELAEPRELPFLRIYESEFIHDVLREKIERIDRLARGHGLPPENTVEWKLRPPSVNDNRKLHDFIAKWSSHDIGLYSLQPNERSGSEIFIWVGVDPANTKLIRSFSLSAHSQCKREGWDSRVSLFSWRPYQRDQVGEETLRFTLWRSEETAVVEFIEWPFRQWHATFTEQTGDPLGREISVLIELPKLSLQGIRKALTSAESFRDQVRRELGTAKSRLLDDIAASRNVTIIDVVLNPRSGIERHANKAPDSFKLTAQQKRALADVADSKTNERIALFEKGYREMYAAIMQAFPIDKYLALERN